MPWIGLPVNLLDIVFLIALGLASIVIPISGVIFVARKRSMSKAEARKYLGPVTHSIATIHSISVFVGAWLLIIWWKKAEWSQVGLVPVDFNWYWKSLLVLFSIYAMIVVVIVAVSYSLTLFIDVKKYQTPHAGKDHGLQIDDFSISGLLSYAVLVPIAEEIVFRGILYGWLRLDMSPTASLVISSIVFGLCHGVGLNGVMTLLLGIGLAVLYEKSGSIVPGIVVHMINNAFSVTLMGLIGRGVIFKSDVGPNQP